MLVVLSREQTGCLSKAASALALPTYLAFPMAGSGHLDPSPPPGVQGVKRKLEEAQEDAPLSFSDYEQQDLVRRPSFIVSW